mgnify:CR=1 FL=1
MDLSASGAPDETAVDETPDSDRPPFAIHTEGSSAADRGTALLPGGDGSILIGGITEGELEPGERGKGKDIFIARYDIIRSRQWVRQIGSDAEDILTAITPGDDGAFYLLGHTAGLLGEAAYGKSDIVIAKYGADGTRSWLKQYGSAEDDLAFAAAATGSSIYIGGSTRGKLVPGNLPQQEDGFIMELDPDGNIVRSTLVGSSRADRVTAIIPGDKETLYIAGTTDGGLHGNATYGNIDGFLANYDRSLAHRWTRQFGTTGADIVLAGAANGANIALAGMTFGSLDHEINAGNYDALLIVFDLNGNRFFSRQHGNDGFDAFYGAAFLADGTVVAAGTSLGAVFSQPAAGGYEIIAVHYDLYGQRRREFQYGTAGDDGVYALSATDDVTTLTGALSGRNSDIPYTGISDYFIMDIKW